MRKLLNSIYFFNLSQLPKYSNQQKRIQRLKLIIYFLVFSVPVIILNDIILAITGEQPYTFEKFPVIVFWLIMLMTLYFNKKHFFLLSKLFIIFIPLAFITTYSLTGYIIGEHFLWQPIMVLGISVIPYLVLDFKTERKWILISFFTFLVYIVFHDQIMFYGTNDNSFASVYNRLNTTPFIYNSVRIIIFLFLSTTIYYSVRLNDHQQLLNEEINISLKQTTDYLEKVNAELHAQRNAINKAASMLIFDRNHKIVSVNKDFLDLSGFHEDQLIGQSLTDLLSTYYDEDFLFSINRELDAGKVWRGELKLKDNVGGYFWMETAISNINDSKNRKNGLLVIMFNITKLKDDEQRLERLNHEKDRILYAVAHDLKNPLLNFKSLLNLIQSGAVTEEEEEKVFGLMARDCDHSTNLIEELLDIGRLEDESYVLTKAPVNLNDFIDNVLKDVEEQSDGKIKLIKSYDDTISLVNLNESEFIRVIHNLMSNAFKFTPDGGEVKIVTRSLEKEKVCIEISDTGVGISKQLLPIIFDKFSKAGRKGLKGQKSTGLGMWIVKHIVKLHDGEISVHSREYEGTTFNIILPR
jgi:PAS domain S-box-containing protein